MWLNLSGCETLRHKLKNGKKCIFCVFRPFLSLCWTASRPDRLSQINQHSAHSKVLLLRAYLKVIFHETMVFSFILGSNRPNQMPRGIRENFCTPRGAQGEGEYRTPNLGSQREQITGATYLIPIWPLLCMIPWYHSIIDCSHCINSQKIHKFLTPLRYNWLLLLKMSTQSRYESSM